MFYRVLPSFSVLSDPSLARPSDRCESVAQVLEHATSCSQRGVPSFTEFYRVFFVTFGQGKRYAIWKLSDLKDVTKTVSLFLFGDVFQTHWKLAVGSVLGILNANFMKETKADEVSFTVDHQQKILHIGSARVTFPEDSSLIDDSSSIGYRFVCLFVCFFKFKFPRQDLGWCKATKKDGGRCTSVVNKSECEFCVYHIKNEFQRSSAKRGEIQSNFSGTGITTGAKQMPSVLVFGSCTEFLPSFFFGLIELVFFQFGNSRRRFQLLIYRVLPSFFFDRSCFLMCYHFLSSCTEFYLVFFVTWNSVLSELLEADFC